MKNNKIVKNALQAYHGNRTTGNYNALIAAIIEEYDVTTEEAINCADNLIPYDSSDFGTGEIDWYTTEIFEDGEPIENIVACTCFDSDIDTFQPHDDTEYLRLKAYCADGTVYECYYDISDMEIEAELDSIDYENPDVAEHIVD